MRTFDFKPEFFNCIKKYDKKTFTSDLMAGLIVGIVALPLAIAFAIASGVTPEKGIVTAIIAGFIISFLGGSKVQIGGPTGAFIVIVYGVVQTYGLGGLAIGMNLARGIRNRSMRRSTTAWTMPATGVRPPLLILVIVLAMAPVAGIPPKIGVTILAMPRAMSSVLELCLALIIPSATVAESRDSMAPSAAMVMAIGKRFFTASQSRAGISAFGRLALMENLSPMVSMQSTPANVFSR